MADWPSRRRRHTLIGTRTIPPTTTAKKMSSQARFSHSTLSTYTHTQSTRARHRHTTPPTSTTTTATTPLHNNNIKTRRHANWRVRNHTKLRGGLSSLSTRSAVSGVGVIVASGGCSKAHANNSYIHADYTPHTLSSSRECTEPCTYDTTGNTDDVGTRHTQTNMLGWL